MNHNIKFQYSTSIKIIAGFLLFLFYTVSMAQTETIYYENGLDGIDKIYKKKSETIVISTFNAKASLQSDVSDNLYEFFKNNPKTIDSVIVLKTDRAAVKGCYKITKKLNLTSVDFYYEYIAWTTGVLEIFCN